MSWLSPINRRLTLESWYTNSEQEPTPTATCILQKTRTWPQTKPTYLNKQDGSKLTAKQNRPITATFNFWRPNITTKLTNPKLVFLKTNLPWTITQDKHSVFSNKYGSKRCEDEQMGSYERWTSPVDSFFLIFPESGGEGKARMWLAFLGYHNSHKRALQAHLKFCSNKQNMFVFVQW